MTTADMGRIVARLAGQRLLEALQAAGIDPAGVVVDPGRPTTTKTRLVAERVLRPAAHLANAAAGLVVRKLGNAVVRPTELAEALGGAPLP